MVVNGEHTMDENGNVVCKCGRSDRFKVVSHIDAVDEAITNYVCKECGNVISTAVKREMCW